MRHQEKAKYVPFTKYEDIEFFRQPKLVDSVRNALMVIHNLDAVSRAKGKDGCFASNKYIGYRLGISEDAAKARLKEARALGYLVSIKYSKTGVAYRRVVLPYTVHSYKDAFVTETRKDGTLRQVPRPDAVYLRGSESTGQNGAVGVENRRSDLSYEQALIEDSEGGPELSQSEITEIGPELSQSEIAEGGLELSRHVALELSREIGPELSSEIGPELSHNYSELQRTGEPTPKPPSREGGFNSSLPGSDLLDQDTDTSPGDWVDRALGLEVTKLILARFKTSTLTSGLARKIVKRHENHSDRFNPQTVGFVLDYLDAPDTTYMASSYLDVPKTPEKFVDKFFDILAAFEEFVRVQLPCDITSDRDGFAETMRQPGQDCRLYVEFSKAHPFTTLKEYLAYRDYCYYPQHLNWTWVAAFTLYSKGDRSFVGDPKIIKQILRQVLESTYLLENYGNLASQITGLPVDRLFEIREKIIDGYNAALEEIQRTQDLRKAMEWFVKMPTYIDDQIEAEIQPKAA